MITDLGYGILSVNAPTQFQTGGIRRSRYTIWYLGGSNIQSKRQRAARKNDAELAYQYVGQIFCETFHKEFYRN